MRNVTAGEVKATMMKKNISEVDHHDCCFCGVFVKYVRVNEDLFFDPSCRCRSSELEPVTWKEAAEFVNRQRDEKFKKKIAEGFGILLE